MNSSDPFQMVASASDYPKSGEQIDWRLAKDAILSALNIESEYQRLGVKFSRSASSAKGWRECYALGREDTEPSAAVNVRSGVYKDSGAGGEVLGFFDFAMKHGNFEKWMACIGEYAARAGVQLDNVKYGSKGRVREAEYIYRDADGQVGYAVFRYRAPSGKKTFTQHPPDGKGGWVHGSGCMDGVTPLPYRLPELLASPLDMPVFVAEGEKDVDRLVSLGLVATTNHQGASSTDATWPHFVHHFAGRIVRILPDNDKGGIQHARKVAAYLRPVAASVKLVPLPGLPNKGDCSDWIDAGGDVEELAKLAEEAPEFDPSAPEAETPADRPDEQHIPEDDQVFTVCFDDVEAVPVEWLWPKRVAKKKVTLFAGEAKQGKSFLTIDMASRVSTGGLVPCGEGGECMPQGSVLFLSAEDDLDDTMKPRLMACGADTSRIHAFTGVRGGDGREGMFDLSQIYHLERAIMRLGDCQLVVIDPITAYIGGKIDDHKASALRSVLGPLKDLAKRQEVAIVIVTHHNKGNSPKALNRVTGSGAYTALARSNWLICKDPDNPKRRLFLSAGTNLVEDPDGLAYTIDPIEKRIVWEDATIPMTADDLIDKEREPKGGGESKENASKVEQAEAWLADILSGGREIPSDEVINQGKGKGFTRDVLFAAKKRLGIKARKGGFHGGWAWFMPPVTSDSSDGSNSSHPSDSSDAWDDGPDF